MIPIATAYFDSREEALQEVRRRKAEPNDDNILVRYERTGYGNWRVYSVPADFVVDSIADGPSPISRLPSFRPQASDWAK